MVDRERELGDSDVFECSGFGRGGWCRRPSRWERFYAGLCMHERRGLRHGDVKVPRL